MATRNFRPDTVLGEGGFSSAFKAWFDEQTLEASTPRNGTVFVVKRLNKESLQNDKKWLLIGYCLEDDRRLLVYEFIRRGSLENHLFRRGSVEPLSWNLRMKIALGAAKGLACIHNHESKMISCDIRSSSILVAYDHTAKLSNLWWGKHKQLEPASGIIVDEYEAIQHLLTGSTPSPEEEIYNFGTVLLEVLTGKRNIEHQHSANERVDFIRPYLDNKQGIKRIIDDRINGQYATSVAIRFAMIVKRCLSIEPRERPTADKVVQALEELQDTQIIVPTPRVQKVSDRRRLISAATSTSANKEQLKPHWSIE
ncbi:hypothetical protein OSB04_016254 [Centaurea solstitialis]|uniref:Protein kinase domain-containing protein n=1 Tax=Centaurea solstitialis TaxID=347529 RepID=A0AA38T0K5_9ASTR|nr:hypothetical protein OSB04_016254 [Centaurea solstitialis]